MLFEEGKKNDRVDESTLGEFREHFFFLFHDVEKEKQKIFDSDFVFFFSHKRPRSDVNVQKETNNKKSQVKKKKKLLFTK